MINLESRSANALIQKINDKIDAVKLELNKINDMAVQGAILRTKARWMSQSEHNTKYFFALEKRKAKNSTTSTVYNKEGRLTSNQGEILNVQAKYFADLYRLDKNLSQEIPGISEKKLNDQVKNELDEAVTMQEIQETIKTMARNKSPGISGFSIDLYIIFWNRLKQPFLEMIQQIYQQKMLHELTREGIITLLPKSDRDLNYVKNWRPIILLNTEYKIISKVIANWIKGMLNELINIDQTGFVKGWLISENLRKILDVIHLADRNDLSGLLICIDFAKAFDNVEYGAVRAVLRWFNFGPNLIQWIDILFKGFTFSTYSNGYFSNPIQVTKGLFQGNPIAPYLFVLVIEVLATMLRKNGKIKGLKIGNEELLLTLFADDLGILIENDKETWNETFRELEKFKEITGLKINYDKTIVYQLGSAKDTNAQYYTVKRLMWSNEPLKMLGVMICENGDQLFKLNYEPLLEKVEQIIKQWKNRGLTLMGKVLLVNSLVVPLFVHKLTVLPLMPEDICNKIHWLIDEFIWKGGKPKISREIITGLKENGGAGLINMGNKEWSVKLQWIEKTKIDPIIRELCFLSINNPIALDIWEIQLGKKDCIKLFSKDNFWKEMLCKKSELNCKGVNHGANIREQLIWFNSEIRIQNKPVFYEDWYASKNRKVGDLLDDQKIISYEKFCTKFEFEPDRLQFYGIISSIPGNWKKRLSRDDTTNVGNRVTRTAKMIYKELQQNIDLLSGKVKRMSTLLGEEINTIELINMTWKLKPIMICVKLRSFQYKLLLGAIVTNVQLKWYRIKETNNCSFCNAYKEDYKHLFYDCRYVQQIWSFVTDYLKLNELTFYQIYTNKVVINPRHVKNVIILIVKFYIYKTRCSSERVSMKSCENYIKHYRSIEEQIARNSGKLHLHNQKWLNYM